MVLARAYDLARSRLRDDLKLLEEHPDYKDRLKNVDYEQGRLSLYELALMLTTAYISLVAFLEGQRIVPARASSSQYLCTIGKSRFMA
jgi:hypothetical protein